MKYRLSKLAKSTVSNLEGARQALIEWNVLDDVKLRKRYVRCPGNMLCENKRCPEHRIVPISTYVKRMQGSR